MSSCNGTAAGPEYQVVPENSNHARQPSVSTQAEYDVVPDKSDHPPPLPGPRLVTTNPVYETKGNTFSHPATLTHRQDPPCTKDRESELDYKEGTVWRPCMLICLSVLVAVGLVLAVAAVSLVLVMWFGVHVPGCPEVVPTMEPVTGNNSNCSCQTGADIHTELEILMNETRALAEQLSRLNSSFVNVSNIHTNKEEVMIAATTLSSTGFTDLFEEAESLSMSVMAINSSCLNMLEEVRSTPVSLENTTFTANLTNATIFGSCLYEYLSNCTMNTTTDACQTEAHPITVDGYYNLEQTCHVAIQLGMMSSPRFAPVNNLVIESGMMSCSCAAVSVTDPPKARSATFNCFLFRARCPVASDLGVPIIKSEL